MIGKVRDEIIDLRDKKIMFRYNGSRNQIEEFEGIITNSYNYVFVIETGNIKKSFSYADVLIGNLDVNIWQSCFFFLKSIDFCVSVNIKLF